MIELIGRFHPVLVHLPIGILLLACLFILLSLKEKYVALKPAIPMMLFWGAVGAIASCITGYFLSTGGDYNGKTVATHQWMGIAVAVISTALWILFKKISNKRILFGVSIVLILLISIAGHLGGSLTHGEDYLTAPMSSNNQDQAAIPAITNIQDAFVYEDAIRPLLKSRCYTCHGAEKQKGRLRLDDEKFILKGGKSGPSVVKGKPDESELIKRLLLPLANDKHMAPKEKPQLTEDEIALLKWWIDKGADFNKKFRDLEQPVQLKNILTRLEKGQTVPEAEKQNDLPEEEVAMADETSLKKLIASNVSIAPVVQHSNYLTANFVNSNFDKGTLALVPKIEKQLIWLKLDNNRVNDQILETFAHCKNLIRLSLNYSNITDAGLLKIKDLEQLQSLSLVGTKITSKGVEVLKKLPKLKYLYVYRTNISPSEHAKLHKLFPKVQIDTGGYQIPFLALDTVKEKAPIK